MNRLAIAPLRELPVSPGTTDALPGVRIYNGLITQNSFGFIDVVCIAIILFATISVVYFLYRFIKRNQYILGGLAAFLTLFML